MRNKQEMISLPIDAVLYRADTMIEAARCILEVSQNSFEREEQFYELIDRLCHAATDWYEMEKPNASQLVQLFEWYAPLLRKRGQVTDAEHLDLRVAEIRAIWEDKVRAYTEQLSLLQQCQFTEALSPADRQLLIDFISGYVQKCVRDVRVYKVPEDHAAEAAARLLLNATVRSLKLTDSMPSPLAYANHILCTLEQIHQLLIGLVETPRTISPDECRKVGTAIFCLIVEQLGTDQYLVVKASSSQEPNDEVQNDE